MAARVGLHLRTPHARVAKPRAAARSVAASAAMDPQAKLDALRTAMDEAKVDAYVVPTEDPHMSEYAPDCMARRAFISGFTGSAGTAVVTKKDAALWTDGRYFLQAERELPSSWTLVRAGLPGSPDVGTWLATNLSKGEKVGIDPWIHTVEGARNMRTQLEEMGIQLAPNFGGNLVDKVWKEERPPMPDIPVRVHPVKLAGKEVEDKLMELRKQLEEKKADAIVVTPLDEVAWLLNIRGGDILHCPVTLSYVVVTQESCTLYVDQKKITEAAAEHLQGAKVEIKNYEDVLEDVQDLARRGCKIWLDPAKANLALYEGVQDAVKDALSTQKRKKSQSKKRKSDGDSVSPALSLDAAVVEAPSPIAMAKAIKNPAELEGMREAHLRDAAALAEFYAWLESSVLSGESLEEAYVAQKLIEIRSKQAGYLDESFSAIVGVNSNGAIIHYKPEFGKCKTLDPKGMLLLDCGAQYDCGTTDITRTFHFGEPSEYQKECYTRVLQGHIGLDTATFPEGTPGFVLDGYARRALWQAGLDYRHGTGHGVGAALNVHEGPQGVSPRYGNQTGIVANMILSNEPGYYEDGAFGIRIENLVIVKEANTSTRFGGVAYLGFEQLTLVPIEVKLLDLDLLTTEEVKWLNNYHAKVWEMVSPRCSGAALEWLKAKTKPVCKEGEVDKTLGPAMVA